MVILYSTLQITHNAVVLEDLMRSSIATPPIQPLIYSDTSCDADVSAPRHCSESVLRPWNARK